MFVKQVTIQGFKSYKDQTVMDPFSPRVNVIVGRNGSGKSNFLSAIRFVLSDAYTHLSREERLALLHEGSGTATMSAYVEIVFDNTDRRLPTGKDLVYLRRTIGLKKDEYSLDKTSTTKSDVMNLLEAAGFSRSNPFYIVPQGRITSLTNAKDSDRLLLLKEVAGTQVYEKRRIESLKLMQDTDNKREKVDELLSNLQERLNELDEEKKDLKEYQKLDSSRKSLDYTLLERELTEISVVLETIEDARHDYLNKSQNQLTIFNERDNQIKNIQLEIDQLLKKIKYLQYDLNELQSDSTPLRKKIAKFQLNLQSLEEQLLEEKSLKSKKEKNFKKILDQISNLENDLNSLTPEYTSLKEKSELILNQLIESERIQTTLYNKQGQYIHFSNKNERDNWLKNEINNLKKNIQSYNETLKNSQDSLKSLELEKFQYNEKISSLKNSTQDYKNELNSLEISIDDIKSKRDTIIDKRKLLLREEARLRADLHTDEATKSNAESLFYKTMDMYMGDGLKSVKRLATQHDIQGVHGMICELFQVDDIYKLATEVTAGTSLFHVVVDNDTVASKLMELLTKERSGRVTFMPLNRLNPRTVSFPENDNSIPLISQLKFDPKFTNAFKTIFGQTIICSNLEIGSEYARAHGLSAITLNGDRADKKGALTGGYYDQKNSRLTAFKQYNLKLKDCERKTELLYKLQKDIESLNQQITHISADITKRKAEFELLQTNIENNINEQKQLIFRINKCDENIRLKNTEIKDLQSEILTLQKEEADFSKDLQEPFVQKLSESELDTLKKLNVKIPNLKSQYNNLLASLAEIEEKKLPLEAELNENLYKQKDRFDEEVKDTSPTANQKEIQEVKSSLKKLNNNLEKVIERQSELNDEITELNSELIEKQQEISQLQQRQSDEAKSLQKQQKLLQRNAAKRGLLLKRKNEINTKIREIGALPENAFERYQNDSSENILKQLNQINNELKKFSHVNKKAFEQYSNFNHEKDSLLTRKEQLADSQESIQELIMVLDSRKDEAIERTFKAVSKYFSEIFEELVPNGKGRLIIRRKADKLFGKNTQYEEHEKENENENEIENVNNSTYSIENYIGIAIEVSFNSNENEQLRIEQLSGGQKSLCALALIFAIQKCDPAPFYLFDEIDANLDAQYRGAIAKIIHSLAEKGNTQFICTTFRQELLQVADKFYGVLFNNKISTIESITQENALSFVEGQQQS